MNKTRTTKRLKTKIQRRLNQLSASTEKRDTRTLVLITGATSGIGYATTEILLKNGYRVLGTGRRVERLSALVRKYPGQCESARLDVSNEKSVRDFFKKYNPENFAILINNAGLALGTQKVTEAQFADWQKMIDVNVLGLMRVTSHLLPRMAKKPNAHIVNIGSVAGKWVYPGGAVYCATKAAVRIFSEGLRMDLLGQKVRVTNIEPGMVETEFSVVRTGSKEMAKRIYAGMTPLTAHDIAESILWCLTRPAHVNVSELTIYPTDQAGVGPHLVARNSSM